MFQFRRNGHDAQLSSCRLGELTIGGEGRLDDVRGGMHASPLHADVGALHVDAQRVGHGRRTLLRLFEVTGKKLDGTANIERRRGESRRVIGSRSQPCERPANGVERLARGLHDVVPARTVVVRIDEAGRNHEPVLQLHHAGVRGNFNLIPCSDGANAVVFGEEDAVRNRSRGINGGSQKSGLCHILRFPQGPGRGGAVERNCARVIAG